MQYRSHLRAALLAAALTLPAISAFAQGKIAGQVSDASGSPLPGVNVLIDGTQQGTATDSDGNYVLVNVRPGTYTLVFSFIGFQTKQIEDVRVATGQTTRIDTRLNEAVFEGQEVIVQAERPLVQKDLTASKKTVVAEEIEALPVEGFLGVLTTQAGVTQGADGAIHIRGGRSNEISYLVDGMSVANPFNTNGLATTVAADAIQEMTVISGAFNAEYGRAMSGIVNLVTKEGSQTYEGSVSAYGGDYVTTHDDIFLTPSGVQLNNTVLEGTLSGPIPLLRNVNFFASARYDQSDGSIFGMREHLPTDSANFTAGNVYYELQGVPYYEYIDRTIVLPDGTTQVIEAQPLPAFERVGMNPSESLNLLGKLTARPVQGLKVEYSYLYDFGKRKPFNQTLFDYRYNPDGVETYRDRGQNHQLGFTHTLNDRAFYTLRLSYALNRFTSYLYEDPLDPRYISSNNIRGVATNNFNLGGLRYGHVYEDSRSLRGKFDFTRQFGIIHEAKAGLDVQYHLLDRENFVVQHDDTQFLEPTVEPVTAASHDKYENQKVIEFAVYAQDKLEFDNFIINVGLRFERFDPNSVYIPDLTQQFALYVPALDGLRFEGDTLRARPTAEAKNIVMPRLGVSFPITERGIIHFSYGHFAQMPPLRRLYFNPELDFADGSTPTFGNADMRPERTVQYEFGLQQQLTDQLAFDITGFYKDIRDYLAEQLIVFSTIAGQDRYRIYLNKDYANVRGLTFALTKRRGRNGLVSANIDYTFQLAEGNDNAPDAFFFNSLSGRETELEIVPLDFDQQHVLSSTVTISKPNNWGISFIGQLSSGYPYSPDLLDQIVDLEPNSGRKPTQLKLDAHLYKDFAFGPAKLRAFAKVFNVFDRLNERFVFDETGRARYSLSDERGLYSNWEALYGLPGIHTGEEYDTRPHWYSAPRQIRLGLTLGF